MEHKGCCSETNRKCRFRTQAGTPCKRFQVEGKDHCRLHDGLPDPDALADGIGRISIEVKNVAKPDGTKEISRRSVFTRRGKADPSLSPP